MRAHTGNQRRDEAGAAARTSRVATERTAPFRVPDGAAHAEAGEGGVRVSPARALQQNLERAVYADMLTGGLTEAPLSARRKTAIIAGLSALSWAAIIGVAVAVL